MDAVSRTFTYTIVLDKIDLKSILVLEELTNHLFLPIWTLFIGSQITKVGLPSLVFLQVAWVPFSSMFLKSCFSLGVSSENMLDSIPSSHSQWKLLHFSRATSLNYVSIVYVCYFHCNFCFWLYLLPIGNHNVLIQMGFVSFLVECLLSFSCTHLYYQPFQEQQALIPLLIVQ